MNGYPPKFQLNAKGQPQQLDSIGVGLLEGAQRLSGSALQCAIILHEFLAFGKFAPLYEGMGFLEMRAPAVSVVARRYQGQLGCIDIPKFSLNLTPMGSRIIIESFVEGY